jgi:transcriptional regulator GlxA family with amidase domain
MLRKLNEADGQLSIKALAEEIGCSQKHLITLFRNAVGTTPKNYCRLLRFEKALGFMQGSSAPDWADIALACGYYDQPHFIREFRAFAGETPNMFKASPDHKALA